MNAKQKFIEMVEMLINAYNVQNGVETPLNLDLKYTEALAYFETLKVEKTKEKVAFTDNGKLILQYMIDKYAKGESLELARQYYFDIVNYEMDEIMKGRGKQDAAVHTLTPFRTDGCGRRSPW